MPPQQHPPPQPPPQGQFYPQGFPPPPPGAVYAQGPPQMPQNAQMQQGMPQGMPPGMPPMQGMPQGMPQQMPQQMPQGMPQGIPQQMQGFPMYQQGQPVMVQGRILEFLDGIRHEYGMMMDEIFFMRSAREQLEERLRAQMMDLQSMQSHIAELERKNNMLRVQLEDEKRKNSGTTPKVAPPVNPAPNGEPHGVKRLRDDTVVATPLGPRPPVPFKQEVAKPATQPSPKVTPVAHNYNQPLTGTCEIDSEAVDPHDKGEDWNVAYNSLIPRQVDVSLGKSLDHNSVVCCVRFSLDGKSLATGCARTAQIFDVETGNKLMELQDENAKEGEFYIRAVVFSPDGVHFASGGEDRLIRVWDLGKKRVRWTLHGHDQHIYSLDWSKDGKYVVSGSGDRTVKTWDVESGRALKTMMNDDDTTMTDTSKDSGVTCVVFSPTKDRLIAASSLDNMVRLWDGRTGALLERFEGHLDSVYSVAFTHDGKRLVSASLDKTVKIWTISEKVLHHMDTNAEKFEPIISKTCLQTFGSHKDYILSVSTGLVFPGHETGDECKEWIASSSKDRSVIFWNADGKPHDAPLKSVAQFLLNGHKNSVIAVTISPVGGHFATASGDTKARIWKYHRHGHKVTHHEPPKEHHEANEHEAPKGHESKPQEHSSHEQA